MARTRPRSTLMLAVTALLLVGSSASGSSSLVSPDPGVPRAAVAGCPVFPGAAAFVDRIDNRYMPLIPGATYIYRGSEDGEEQRNVVEVTAETKTILGVKAVVVLDTVTDRRGDLIEQTLDWFAQDAAGNVWYLGEDSKDYEHGQVVSTEGSWEAGVNGAQAGIVMEALPSAGDAYKQECAPAVAEDEAEVLKLTHKVKSPYGNFTDALLTQESTPLEPGVAEQKAYAPCIGLVRVVITKGGKGSTSLVDVQNAPSPTELGCPPDGKNKHKNRHKNKHRRDD